MDLSLAGWSLHSRFKSGELALVDFPAFTARTFGLRAVELNSPFFASTDGAYLAGLRRAADSAGVALLNIAVDESGDMASPDPAQRAMGVANYAKWIPVAAELGLPLIRANSGGYHLAPPAPREAVGAAISHAIDGFRALADVGLRHGVRVVIENHWGVSSDPDAMLAIVSAVAASHGPAATGTMPDFGNWPDTVERLGALRKVMPYAYAVHAKVNAIDAELRHLRFDHAACIAVARGGGYDGYLGIEYEGPDDALVGIPRGVTLLKRLLAATA